MGGPTFVASLLYILCALTLLIGQMQNPVDLDLRWLSNGAAMDEDFFMDLSESLFSSLNQPFDFPNPREIGEPLIGHNTLECSCACSHIICFLPMCACVFFEVVQSTYSCYLAIMKALTLAIFTYTGSYY